VIPAGTHESSVPATAGALATSEPAAAGPREPLSDLRDLAEGALIVAVAVVVWIAASALPAAPVENELSSGVWPKTLAIALGVLGAALIVEALRGRVKRDETLDPVNAGQWPMFAGTLAVIVAFLVAWQAVGFLVSAIVCFVLLSRLLGVGNWLRSALWGSGLAVLMWVLFEMLLNIPL
jgi:tripartite tricarboxylate transporter TctB family protein